MKHSDIISAKSADIYREMTVDAGRSEGTSSGGANAVVGASDKHGPVSQSGIQHAILLQRKSRSTSDVPRLS